MYDHLPLIGGRTFPNVVITKSMIQDLNNEIEGVETAAIHVADPALLI
jgi:hypothetical protein